MTSSEDSPVAMSMPEQREPIHALLRDGRQVALRPARPEDEAALAALYARLGGRDARLWFPGAGRRGTAGLAPDATGPASFGHSVTAWEDGDLIGAAAYQGLGSSREAEVTVAVSGQWQSRGVGALLLEHLVSHARLRGIESFHAEVPSGDAEMLRVLADLGPGRTPIAPATGLPGRAEAGVLAGTRDWDDVVAIDLPLRYDDLYLDVVAERERLGDVLRLCPVFAPRSVAVIGASRRDASVGNAVVRHLLTAGFRGPVHPVNPHASDIAGVPALPVFLRAARGAGPGGDSDPRSGCRRGGGCMPGDCLRAPQDGGQPAASQPWHAGLPLRRPCPGPMALPGRRAAPHTRGSGPAARRCLP